MFTNMGGRVNPTPTAVAEISVVAKGIYRLVFSRVAGKACVGVYGEVCFFTRAIRPCPSRIYFGRLFYYPKGINYETDNLSQPARGV